MYMLELDNVNDTGGQKQVGERLDPGLDTQHKLTYLSKVVIAGTAV